MAVRRVCTEHRRHGLGRIYSDIEWRGEDPPHYSYNTYNFYNSISPIAPIPSACSLPPHGGRAGVGQKKPRTLAGKDARCDSQLFKSALNLLATQLLHVDSMLSCKTLEN